METKKDFLVELPSKNVNIRVFRDDEISTTWKISNSAKRFYRDCDFTHAVQDIKFSDELTESQVMELLYEKAEKYRRRILKNGYWRIGTGCYTDSPVRYIDLEGDGFIINESGSREYFMYDLDGNGNKIDKIFI